MSIPDHQSPDEPTYDDQIEMALGRLWRLCDRHALNLQIARHWDDAISEWCLLVSARTGRSEMPYGISVQIGVREETVLTTIEQAGNEIEAQYAKVPENQR